jgi:hypothetical protein
MLILFWVPTLDTGALVGRGWLAVQVLVLCCLLLVASRLHHESFLAPRVCKKDKAAVAPRLCVLSRPFLPPP